MDDEKLIQKYSKNGFRLIKTPAWILIQQPKFESRPEITGKYLFFSKNREQLVEVCQEIMEKYKLSDAKVPTENYKIGEDWILCIYDIEPRFKDELRQYQTPGIKYRYWKTDKETREGKYSAKFLKELQKSKLEIKKHL